MNFHEVIQQAKNCIGPFCKACPICNGIACKNTMPGPGAKGTGDGTDPNVMTEATAAIRKANGSGIPTIKPWDMETIREKLELVKASGAFAVAMDIDAAGLPFLQNLNPPAGSKSVEELKEIVKMAEVPFILKGIMTANAARKARGSTGDHCLQSWWTCTGSVPGDCGGSGRNCGCRGSGYDDSCGRRNPERRRSV